MTKHSKRYRALAPNGPTMDSFPLAVAVDKLKKFGTTKFDQTVEIHIRLGVDPKQADQIVRGSVVLPNGIGRSQRVAVFAKGDLAAAAEAAGADFVGQEDLAQKIKDGWTEFDVCIAAPDMMGLVGPLGHVYGMERFGASAPFKVLDEQFGYTASKVVAEAERYLAEFKEKARRIANAIA